MKLAITIPQIDLSSDEELWKICVANGEAKIERSENGMLEIQPLSGIQKSFQNSDLNYEINIWNRTSCLGRVSDSNGGYILPDTSMRAPDIAWISNERLKTVSDSDLKKFANVCPDFVIELRSESDELIDLQQKMSKWILNGVLLGWLVDPEKKQTLVFRPGQEVEIVPFSNKLYGWNVLPGLEVKLSEVF